MTPAKGNKPFHISTVKLSEPQQEMYDNFGHRTIYLAARQTGKSHFLSFMLSTLLLTQSKKRYLFVNPTLKQGRQAGWLYFKEFLDDVPFVRLNSSELTIYNDQNGSEIRVIGAGIGESSTVRGLSSDGIVFDEIKDISHRAFHEDLVPCISRRNGFMIISGTPSGSLDLFASLYKEFTANADARVLQFKASEMNLHTPEFLAEQRQRMSPSSYAREYEASLDSPDSDVLFDILMLNGATTPATEKELENRQRYGYRPVLAGLDLGVRNDDSVLTLICGLDILHQERIPFNTTSQFNQNLRKILGRYRCKEISIDAGGLGQGIILNIEEFLYHDNVIVNSIDFGSSPNDKESYPNKRCEMFGLLANWIKWGGKFLPATGVGGNGLTTLLVEELSNIRTQDDPHERLSLISKKEIRKAIGRSTDTADSTALCFATQAESWEDPPPRNAAIRDIQSGAASPAAIQRLTEKEIINQFSNDQEFGDDFYANSYLAELDQENSFE